MTYQYLLLPGEAYLQPDGAGGVVHQVRSGLADERSVSIDDYSTVSKDRIKQSGTGVKVVLLDLNCLLVMLLEEVGLRYPQNVGMKP